jgi:hypothetical protein
VIGRRSIVSQLENKFQCDEINAMDSRRLTGRMSLNEKMSRWGDTVTVGPSESFQSADDEEDVADERDTFAFSEVGKTILKSSAYEWLIFSLVKEVSFRWEEAQPRTMVDQIRQGVLSQLPIGRISSRRPPDRHTVSFKIPKSSLPFITEDQRTQPTMNPPMMIADRIAITSASACSAQLSKVSQYMDQTWPLGGRTLLSVIQNVINGPGPPGTSSMYPS